MKRIPINEAIINIDQEPPESVYAWYYYQKFISYFDKNFTEWTAYKLGIIDKNGEILKIPKTNIEKSALNAIANLVRKLKIHMKKHSSDSIIKIISYYLKYGFRTTSQALIESYAEDELKIVERVLKMDKSNKFKINEMKQSFTIEEPINFKETVGISFIQQFTKDITITVNSDKFKELIKDFFNYEDILIEIQSFARYTILSEKNAEKKTYDVFNFPKLISIKYEGKKIGSIIFRVVSTESVDINYDMIDDSFDVEFEAIKTYFDETKDYYSTIYDVSDVLKTDVFASKMKMYYAGSDNIDFFSAIQKGDRLVIDAMDELVAKEFIDMMGESYSITISKDESKGKDQDVQPEPNEELEDISGESTIAATALTGYAPPLGKPKKRKVNESSNIDDEYFEAIEANNTEKLKSLVKSVAESAGYKIGPVYHGTNNKILKFDKKIIDKNYGGYLVGFHFSENFSTAKQYASQITPSGMKQYVMELYLKSNNTYEPDNIRNDRINRGIENYKQYTNQIKSEGYDGIRYKHNIDENSNEYEYAWVVFEPNQIKSADLVVYDDNGGIIPLSKRFSNSDDIREIINYNERG